MLVIVVICRCAYKFQKKKKKVVCSLLRNLRARLVNKSVAHSIVNKTLSNRETSKYRKLSTTRATATPSGMCKVLDQRGEKTISGILSCLRHKNYYLSKCT